jgi:hypothetical protein
LLSVQLAKTQAKIYANAKVANALEELTDDLSLYHGVRFTEVLEAVYQQGLRDGRREVFNELDVLKKRPELKHVNPGRPKQKMIRKAAPKQE